MTTQQVAKILLLFSVFGPSWSVDPTCYIPPGNTNGEVNFMDPHGALSGQICEVKGFDSLVQIHYMECMPFFCCENPCYCGSSMASEQDTCTETGGTAIQISCFSINEVFAYQLFQCCPGWVELGNTTVCVPDSNCNVNNGGCNTTTTTCQPSVNETGVCQCIPGYTAVDDKNCIEINYCDINNGGCAQLCHSLLGSSYCTCNPGYELAADNMNCISVPPDVVTVIINNAVTTEAPAGLTMIYIIIGSVLGFLLLCLLPLLLLLLLCCRRRRKQPPPTGVVAYANTVYETNLPPIVIPTPPPPYEEPIKDKKGLPPMDNVTEVRDEELGACSKPPPAYDSIHDLADKDSVFYEKSDCSYKKKGSDTKRRRVLESQTSQTELIDDYNNQCDAMDNEKNVYAEIDDVDAKLGKKCANMK